MRTIRPPPKVQVPRPPAHLFEAAPSDEQLQQQGNSKGYQNAPPSSISNYEPSFHQQQHQQPATSFAGGGGMPADPPLSARYPVNDPEFDKLVREEMQRMENSIADELARIEAESVGGGVDLTQSQVLMRGISRYASETGAEATPRFEPSLPPQSQSQYQHQSQYESQPQYSDPRGPISRQPGVGGGGVGGGSQASNTTLQPPQPRPYPAASAADLEDERMAQLIREKKISSLLSPPRRMQGLSHLHDGGGAGSDNREKQALYARQLQEQVEQGKGGRGGMRGNDQVQQPAHAYPSQPSFAERELRNGDILEYQVPTNTALPPPSSSLLDDMYGRGAARPLDRVVVAPPLTMADKMARQLGTGLAIGSEDSRATRRAKQDEYRRQLDRENDKSAVRGLERGGQDRVPERGSDRGQRDTGYTFSGHDDVQVQAAPSSNPSSLDGDDPAKALKRRQQADYKLYLDSQVAQAAKLKEDTKLKDKEDDRAVLDLEHQAYEGYRHPNPNLNTTIIPAKTRGPAGGKVPPPRKDGAGGAGAYALPPQPASPPRHSQQQLQYEQQRYQQQQQLEQQYLQQQHQHQQHQHQQQYQRDGAPEQDYYSEYPNPSEQGHIGSPNADPHRTQARQRLISDVYGSAPQVFGHSNAQLHDTWKPSGKNLSDKQKNAMMDQRQALQAQMEEDRRKKAEEKWRLKLEEEEEERRVRAELASLGAGGERLKERYYHAVESAPPSNPMGGNTGRVANTPPRDSPERTGGDFGDRDRMQPQPSGSPARARVLAPPPVARPGGRPADQGQASARHGHDRAPPAETSYREPRDFPSSDRDPYSSSSNPTTYPPPLHYPAHPQQPSYPQAYPGTHYPGGPRPSTADVADNFLLSWQRSVAGTSGIPGMSGVPAHILAQQQQLYGSSSDPYAYQQAPPAAGGRGPRESAHRETGRPEQSLDVSFVSESRMLPADAYGAQGLLSVLGSTTSGHAPAPAYKSVYASGASDYGGGYGGGSLENVSSSFTLPSDRGRLQAGHVMGLGRATENLEASMTSESLLLYINKGGPDSARGGNVVSASISGIGGGSGANDAFDAISMSAATPVKRGGGVSVETAATVPLSYPETIASLSPLSKLIISQAVKAPRPAPRYEADLEEAGVVPDALESLVGSTTSNLNSARGSSVGRHRAPLAAHEEEEEIVVAGGSRTRISGGTIAGGEDSFSVQRVDYSSYADEPWEKDDEEGIEYAHTAKGWNTNSAEQQQLADLLRGDRGLALADN